MLLMTLATSLETKHSEKAVHFVVYFTSVWLISVQS